MIAGIVSDKDGNPVDGQGKKLSPSAYQPTGDEMKLFGQVQNDYQVAYALQHRPFKDFDDLSLLNRARRDQESFGAYVGAEFVPSQKRWRWQGRKNTTRNRLIGILAHMLSAMLFPYVRAVNDADEEEKDTARVMQILVEDHLRRAGYEQKFLYMVVSALVNPAVIVQVEYVQAFQRVKQRLENGDIKIIEAVDELLSGLQMHIVPIDEFLIADFFTFEVQRQPYILRVRRIPWDEARAIYGEHENFKFVEAGKTRVFITGQENQTLYDIEWTEADRDYVQEITAYYRSEDLQVTFVGGVFMGNKTDIYNSNPFQHRRMSLIGKEWLSVPIYPFAKSGFEPLDPTGRFFYYKSAAFKAYWDDASINRAYQLLQDGMFLDVIKPTFISGVNKVDGTVIAPGAVVPLAKDASVTPYTIGSNLAAAAQVLTVNKDDLAESTQDQTQGGVVEKGVTARATIIAEQNAKMILGVFGLMMANLVEQIGALTMDCIIQHATLSEVDEDVPEGLKVRFRTYLAESEDSGKKLSNRIVFTDEFMGLPMSKEEKLEKEWELYEQSGDTPKERYESSQRIYKVNPYKFARMRYSMFVDADKIVSRSMGTDRMRKREAFEAMMDPRVAPFTDQKAVAEDFVINEYSEGDPDKYKLKGDQMNAMMNAVMGQQNPAMAAPGAQPELATNPVA